MIRAGRAAGWLQLPPEAFVPWAKLNDVVFDRVVPATVHGRGGALLASTDISHKEGAQELPKLMTVPAHLILSLERIDEHAKVDKDFREVLESLGEFGRTSRGAILLFLLFQASISCPDVPQTVGVHCPFTDYVKTLPDELLPTFWTHEELRLLVGSTLAPAVSSKLRSLHREYDHLCSSAMPTTWFSTLQHHFSFDDWLQVDAMYRSRALDFPAIGHCMVPCVDLANHQSGIATVAIYEKDPDGNALLQLREGKQVKSGDEVTITYGDEKGACEMLFSYGFLEESMQSAETLFLSLAIPDDDPCRSAKVQAADCAPGFKLIDAGDGDFDWKGDFIWLLCVNAEDGLRFEIARTIEGAEEIQAFFQDQELTGGAAQLYTLLGQSDLWPVYRLRAVAILQQRVFDQMQVLYSTQDDMEAVPHGDGTEVRERVYSQAMQLRRLEFELLETAYGDFEKQKLELVENEVVKQYLANNGDAPSEEDFS